MIFMHESNSFYVSQYEAKQNDTKACTNQQAKKKRRSALRKPAG